MKIYKKLAGQTIVYGVGTILPRILNYVVLTAYYTRLFEDQRKFGVITELYAYVTFLLIILTYGTETGYFKFSQRDNKGKVFGTLVISLFTTSSAFILIVLAFNRKIAQMLLYQGNEQYIIVLALIVGIDAFSTIPFAKLRRQERSLRFAWLKIVNVLATMAAVLFFYEVLPRVQSHFLFLKGVDFRGDVSYVLYANLFASALILILLLPEIFREKFYFNKKILREVLAYSLPLLIAGLAGTVNDALDRVLMKHLIPDKEQALYVLGIYGANLRIAMLLYIFVQMFRFAVEPFYFNYQGKSDEKEVFAVIMRLFIAVMLILIMGIMFYLDYIKFFISSRYHEGLEVIPVVIVAFFFYGVFFNQSVWYKLIKKTGYAAMLTLVGAIITIIANVFFVKKFSYMASAYGRLFAYFVMMVLSYFIGRKYYRIDYKLLRIAEYLLLALVFFGIRYLVLPDTGWIKDIVSFILIILYAAYILKREKLMTLSKIFKWKSR
ncbi:MAG: oligosaccharide flippase family protein [Bacteroidales bacterium]|nr:oligosaccharide flippase family protein [Bacteroidales bacterium]